MPLGERALAFASVHKGLRHRSQPAIHDVSLCAASVVPPPVLSRNNGSSSKWVKRTPLSVVRTPTAGCVAQRLEDRVCDSRGGAATAPDDGVHGASGSVDQAADHDVGP